MPLPKIDQPIFDLKLPSTGKSIKYRPFTVKEEKILLMAKESGELKDMILAIEQVVNNCIIDDKITVDNLATFDLEYLMLNIRGKAVNDKVAFVIKDPDTEENVDLDFNINDITVKFKEEHNPEVTISDDYKMKMRYPTTRELLSLSSLDSDTTEEEALFNIMISCIDVLYDSDKVYKLKDFTDKEVSDFVDSLPSSAIQQIRTFFNTLPRMRIECPYTNNAGVEKTFVIEGVETFFM